MSNIAKKTGPMSPVIIMVLIVVFATLLTYLLPSGEFAREKKNVIPNSYQQIEKQYSFSEIFIPAKTTPDKEKTATKSSEASKANAVAKPVSIAQMLLSIPKGISQQVGLIFMVMFIGGMFGVLQKSGAIEAGLERSLSLTKGNVYLLVPVLMIFFSFGSTFMGLAKEYLLVIPMVIGMTNRLQLPKVIGLAIVAVAVKVGYLASITNPYALAVAQPLLGLDVFSGMSMRIAAYCVMMTIGILFVLWTIRQYTKGKTLEYHFDDKRLSVKHTALLITLAIGIALMVYGSITWKWKDEALSAYYLFLSIVFAVIAGLRPSEAADAFVNGMKKVMIAAVLIGLATAVAIVLKEGKVIDTIINGLVGFIGEGNSYIAAFSMFFSQLAIDVVIPSTSGQAAVTMPIFGPVGQLIGVSPQTTVLAFLMGNGLTNVVTPTSSGLLIFLATAEVSWSTWAKYVWPLIVLIAISALALLAIAVAIGY